MSAQGTARFRATAQQRVAIQHPAGPARVLAGAGSGPVYPVALAVATGGGDAD